MILKYFLLVRSVVNNCISINYDLIPLAGALLGVSLYFHHWGALIPCLLIVALVELKKLYLGLLLPLITLPFILSFWIGNVHFEGELQGEALLHIQKVEISQGLFGSGVVFKGFIRKFRGEDQAVLRHLPFTLYVPKGITPPQANRDFQVQGILKKSPYYGFSFKVDKTKGFVPLKNSFSFAQKRADLKKKFKRFLNKKIPYKGARELLMGMTTGEFSNSFLSFTFSRFGLNHLLAISGFHFGILALFLNALLHFLPRKVRLIGLGVALTFFYFFVGYGPSLQRAWLVSIVYLLGSFSERLTSPIQVLSLSMILVLLLNPFMLVNMGFQFSFGITYAILFFYEPIRRKLFDFVKKRSLIDEWILRILALNIAVHLVAMPLSLYHFHKFYLMSFFFNLWAPFLLSFFLFGFLLLLTLTPIFSSLLNIGFQSLGYLVEKWLSLIYWVPTSFDDCIRVPTCPGWSICIYLFFLVICFAFTQEKKKPFGVFYN